MMRLSIMKVNNSSILNGSQQHYPACKAKNGRIKPAANEHVRIKHKSSVINAKNCANLCNEKAVDGYMTFANDCAYLQIGR